MFLQRPCESIDELFDRERELELSVKALRSGAWISVLGPRMSGKTSLAKVAARIMEGYGYDYVYVNLVDAQSVREAVKRILSSLPKRLIDKLHELSTILSAVGVKIGSSYIELKPRRGVSYCDILEKLFLELSKRSSIVIVLDEVQDVKLGVNHLLAALYRIRTSTNTVLFVFTGSAIGIMKTLLSPSSRNPMYGRSPIRIELEPWSRTTAREFLERGLKACRASYKDKELEEAIDILGTLPGWLSFYGLRRCIGIAHSIALQEALENSVNIARQELLKAIERRGTWARKALRYLAIGATWSELLNELQISTQTLRDFLDVLQRLYLVTRGGNIYRIADPVYREAAKRI